LRTLGVLNTVREEEMQIKLPASRRTDPVEQVRWKHSLHL